ncbi:MAG TPA: histidine kinase [Bacilli bacterium]|nr:histidine kinase [Bacilli bacterium]
MNYKLLKWYTILLPTFLIGGFEFIRHLFLLPYLSMEAGNFLITGLTFVLAALFASWMFRTIQRINERLSAERSRRAVYEERERLARELHDGIAQTLFFLGVKLKQGRLEEARSAVSDIEGHVRQAIFNLRQGSETQSLFRTRVTRWLAEWSLFTNIEVEQEVQVPDPFLTPSEEVLLFGVIQEAFTNIRKHANATHATLTLRAGEEGDWELVIGDDGRGFDPQAANGGRYGLAMLAERAAKLDAKLDIRSAQDGEHRGTELRLHHSKGGTQ